MQICTKCGLEKVLNSFSPNRHKRSGLQSQCKRCCQEYQKERRKTPCGLKALKKYQKSNQGKERRRLASKNQYLLHPERCRARAEVGYAIKTGKLIRQPCEVCGELKVQAHHDDYSKPLDVQWLCKEHHL